MKRPATWPDDAPIILRDDDDQEHLFRETLPSVRIGRPQGRRLAKPGSVRHSLTGEQRILILDAWKRSELPGAGTCGNGVNTGTIRHITQSQGQKARSCEYCRVRDPDQRTSGWS